MTDARERIALRIEESRALLPFVEPGSLMAAVAAARIGAYETALADIDAWMAEPEEPEEDAPAEKADAAAIAEIAAATAAPPTDFRLVPPSAPPPERPSTFAGGVWTGERIEKLVSMWNAGDSKEAILAAVSALPGEPPSGVGAITGKISDLRERGVELTQRPLGRRAPPPEAVFVGIPDDDVEEARKMMRASDRCGARQLHEYFGWPLTRAQAIAAVLRAQIQAAA
jgi:hypothetical protein